MNRREFIHTAGITTVSLFLPNLSQVFAKQVKGKTQIGVISDLHQDIMHDGEKRLLEFLEASKKKDLAAIIQMGDFAYPSKENTDVIQFFNKAHTSSLHVIGNHDTDGGFTKEQCLEVWDMPSPYYSKVINGILLIVLDGNEKGSPSHTGGYPSFIGSQQLEWLQQELENSPYPVLIVSHQPLAGVIAVDNEKEIQSILSNYSEKILLCINGHSHIDQHLEIEGVNYLHINSASYYWVGGKYKHDSYSESIHQEHPYISSTCPYEQSLFAFLTIDIGNKKVMIEGKKSKWVGKSPDDLGFKIEENPELNEWIMPKIQNRKIQ